MRSLSTNANHCCNRWRRHRDHDPYAPLLVNPKPRWHKLSWFGEFMAAIPHYRDNTIATARRAVHSFASEVVLAKLKEQ